MTIVNAGGIKITSITYSDRFSRDFKKLSPQYKDLFKSKIKRLYEQPLPSGLRFEKLKGYSNPIIYTIHLEGNYKVSMTIDGSTALLRRVGKLIERRKTMGLHNLFSLLTYFLPQSFETLIILKSIQYTRQLDQERCSTWSTPTVLA